MSVPRVLLMPTHRTGLADAIAAAVAEIMTARGQEVRYHHVGPVAPMSAWDRWEGAVFMDPGLSGEEALLGLYDVAVRHADLSLLSSTAGLLDGQEGISWVPTDLARLLDCPVVVIIDCRGWGTGVRVLTSGIKAHLNPLNLAGAILSGVADREHCDLLRKVLAEENIAVAGCLFEGEGLDWDATAPGAWGLPLPADFLEAVARQVDVDGLLSLAGQRGFLSTPNWLSDRGGEGPVVAVAGGKGFTPWSRDSIEVLRSAGAQVRRLDLVEDASLPAGTAGLVLAGTLWPDTIPDIGMNTPLLQDIAAQVGKGLPTVALGGGMLVMMHKLQDTLGRTSELVGVIPVQGEILWDLEDPAYVDVTSVRDNLLLAKGERITGWVLSEVELAGTVQGWDSPLAIRGAGTVCERREGVGTDSLLCSPAMLHLAAGRELAPRFVRQCEGYAERSGRPPQGGLALEK
jgi:cobyrinic acid a,c-diamide synthase